MNEQAVTMNPSLRHLTRREMLRYLGAAAGALAGYGCGRTRSEESNGRMTSFATAVAAAVPACVVRPEQTEGPYFVDAKLNRSDIRTEPSDGSVKPGVSLRLSFQVSRVDGSSCSPLNDAVVHVWQCDALGVYSGVRDMNVGFDTRDKHFLRGYQTTNANGSAEFLTIYPGWYEGRAVHIHFKIRTDLSSRRAYEFTSQLYFDDSITDQVLKQAPYNTRGQRRTTNDADFGFRRGGKQLIPAFTKEAQGYSARFDIGLRIA
jgi:protocatechuate 3,4-dioxygenase beta subunit